MPEMSLRSKIESRKELIESFVSLYVLNGLNLLLPLIALPYLLRVVGPANYGVYSYIYVIIQYVLLIGSYGFDYSATKQISQQRNNTTEINRIFNAVIFSKLLLSFVGLIIFFAFSPLYIKSSENYLILFYGVGIVIGDVFIPVWLFQGLEKMRYLTIVNVISKLFFTILIFVLINEEEDYKYILLLNSFGYLLAGFFSMFIVFKSLRLRLKLPHKVDVISQLKDGLAVFATTLGMNFYRNSNVFILGFFVNDSMIGVYAAAEKIIKALQSIMSPIAQALFPHFGFKFSNLDVKESVMALFRVVKPYSILLSAITMITYFFSPNIITFFGGPEFQDSIVVVKIMSIIILFGGLNYLLGIVGLINLNEQTAFFKTVILSGLVSVFVLIIFAAKYGIFAAAWSMVISEVLLFVLLVGKLLSLKHKKHN
jgi:PST family polysaccharide transporter